MHDSDAIALAAFDDPPAVSPDAAPGPRPAHRPRPGPAGQPSDEAINLVVADSGAASEPALGPARGRERPRLAVDIGIVDPETALFLVVYAAGTPLDALAPRTLAIPPSETGSLVTRLEVHVRNPGELQPVPFRALECPDDLRGQQVTLSFPDPADLRSLTMQRSHTRDKLRSANGQGTTTARERGVDVPMMR